ncbi:MAG: formylglycine-generating enzyme family protein [Thermoguttaceae bacterium]|nr:formylglycine-generating enzyme family protein [Thermoguttaceae bacterium]MBR0193455.1 formylglycine-generating enzyme family protein [Thermoguttaceae bacterium]
MRRFLISFLFVLIVCAAPTSGAEDFKAGERKVLTVDGIEYAFRWCPPGEFMMGSPAGELWQYDGEKQHRVRLTKGFWMLETEVTQAQWKAIMGTTVEEQARKMLNDATEYDFGSLIGKKTFRDLYGFSRDTPAEKLLWGVGPDRPIYYVNWQESVEFCRRLSLRLNQRVQLPTEAQWEYACRAGSTTTFPNGSEIKGTNNAPALDPIAWYGGNSNQDFTSQSAWNASDWPQFSGPCGVHEVGKKEANAWGLHDMIGNVFEWCSDYYDAAYYGKSPMNDPENVTVSSSRVLRGASWGDGAESCRSALRVGYSPEFRLNGLGLRVVLIPNQESNARR